jgi:hypothetical protein
LDPLRIANKNPTILSSVIGKAFIFATIYHRSEEKYQLIVKKWAVEP